jgi:hypothetical protein
LGELQRLRSVQELFRIGAAGNRYTRDVMARHLWALALIAVIAGGPVAARVCQATCTSHDMHAMAGHAHHHSPPSGPLVEAAMNAGPHTCRHQPDETVGVQQSLQLLTAPAVAAVAVFSLPPIAAAALAGHMHDVEHHPPGILPLTTQLRV